MFIRGPSIVYNNLLRTHCIRRQNCLQNKYNNNNNNKNKHKLKENINRYKKRT